MAQARAHYQKRLENALRHGLMREYGYALGNLGSLGEDRGDLDDARELYQRRWEHAGLTGLQEEKIFAASNLGMLELIAGRYESALTWYGQKLRLARESRNREMEAQALTGLSWPLRFRLCTVLLLCPKLLLPTVAAALKRLRSFFLRRGIRHRIESLRE